MAATNSTYGLIEMVVHLDFKCSVLIVTLAGILMAEYARILLGNWTNLHSTHHQGAFVGISLVPPFDNKVPGDESRNDYH